MSAPILCHQLRATLFCFQSSESLGEYARSQSLVGKAGLEGERAAWTTGCMATPWDSCVAIWLSPTIDKHTSFSDHSHVLTRVLAEPKDLEAAVVWSSSSLSVVASKKDLICRTPSYNFDFECMLPTKRYHSHHQQCCLSTGQRQQQ